MIQTPCLGGLESPLTGLLFRKTDAFQPRQMWSFLFWCIMKHSQKYIDYLKSAQWKKRRKAKLQQAKYRCEMCGEKSRLQIHHLNYNNLYNEKSTDLVVLCTSCHWIADEKRRGDNSKHDRFYRPIEESHPNGYLLEHKKREIELRRKRREKRRAKYG